MKYNIHLVIVTFLLLSVTNAFSQKSAPDQIIEAFFKTFKQNPTKAYEELFSGNKWMVEKRGDLETVKIKMQEMLKDVGEYFGYEQITEKSAGENFVLKCYLLKYDRQPVRFTFVFYKPNDKWQILNFSYDLNLAEELEEAAKLYRLKHNW